MLLRNATIASGEVVDVAVADGAIAAVGSDVAGDGETHDLTGYVLLPAAAEPHAHLDKALLGERFPNRTGDIPGALAAMKEAFPSITEDDVRARASRALLTAVRNGYTSVRTHVNIEEGIGTRGLRALCDVRERFAALVDVEIVAMAGKPYSPHPVHQALLAEAIAAGADAVGGAPEFDPDPAATVRRLVALAAEHGLPIDLHLDETTNASVFTLEVYAEEVIRRGLAGRATASHCVSLGQQSPQVARSAARALAEAGVGVVTLPQTNLWLQGRSEATRVPRGLTTVRLLREEGVVLAAGGDNCRDPFNPLGRIDPTETAALLVAAAHVTSAEAWEAVSTNARHVMGLSAYGVGPGSPADLVAMRARNIDDAVAAGEADRWVFRRGELVSRTRVVNDVEPMDLLA